MHHKIVFLINQKLLQRGEQFFFLGLLDLVVLTLTVAMTMHSVTQYNISFPQETENMLIHFLAQANPGLEALFSKQSELLSPHFLLVRSFSALFLEDTEDKKPSASWVSSFLPAKVRVPLVLTGRTQQASQPSISVSPFHICLRPSLFSNNSITWVGFDNSFLHVQSDLVSLYFPRDWNCCSCPI